MTILPTILVFVVYLLLFLAGAYVVINISTGILFFISEQVSLTNIYHCFRTEGKDGETFYGKVLKMCACNFNLTVPVILSFMFIIRNTSIGSTATSDQEFIASLIFSLATLVSLRILSNPTNKTFKPKLIAYFKDGKDRIEQLKIFKERISSFFFSFISATLLFILVTFFYCIVVGYTSLDQLMSIVLNPSIHIQWYDFGILFVCYTFSLFIFTIWGELILRRNVPLVQLE